MYCFLHFRKWRKLMTILFYFFTFLKLFGFFVVVSFNSCSFVPHVHINSMKKKEQKNLSFGFLFDVLGIGGAGAMCCFMSIQPNAINLLWKENKFLSLPCNFVFDPHSLFVSPTPNMLMRI